MSDEPEENAVATPRITDLPMELVATTNVGAHAATSTIVSYLLLARFQEPKLEWTYTTPYLATTRLKFQELPHEYATTPAALIEPAYVFVFYEFHAASNVYLNTYRYTSYENTIIVAPGGSGNWAGTYLPAPFSFDTVKRGLKLDQEKIEIKSFRFNGNPLNKMWPFALDGVLSVWIGEVDVNNPINSAVIIRFYGDVWSIDSDYKATAIPFGNLFERKFPRFLLSVSDNYTQFSLPTQIVASSFVITGTFPAVIDTTSQTVVVTSSGGYAKEQDYFAGGWLETGTGSTFETRGILHSEPSPGNQVTLHLDRPLLKAVPSQALNMYPGYDGSINQCDDKFANRINFGGHAFIPNVNPAVKAVKVKTASGGKKISMSEPSYFDDPAAAEKLREEAISWLGTPFAVCCRNEGFSPYGDVKGRGGGIDCIGLVQEIFKRIGATEEFMFPRTMADYQSNQLGQKVLTWLRGGADNPQSKRLKEILVELNLPNDAIDPKAQTPKDFFKPGDILVMRKRGLFHMPIIYDDGLNFVNALPRLGVIEGTVQDSSYSVHLVAAFRLKPKE